MEILESWDLRENIEVLHLLSSRLQKRPKGLWNFLHPSSTVVRLTFQSRFLSCDINLSRFNAILFDTLYFFFVLELLIYFCFCFHRRSKRKANSEDCVSVGSDSIKWLLFVLFFCNIFFYNNIFLEISLQFIENSLSMAVVCQLNISLIFFN